MIVYQIKCVADWVDNDLSMTNNGKDDDQIEKGNFDQYFDKYMIIDFFRKVECVQFERSCLSNPDVRQKNIRPQVVQEDHVVTAKAIKSLIFNIIFNIRLIKIKISAMKEEVKNIIKYLKEK